MSKKCWKKREILLNQKTYSLTQQNKIENDEERDILLIINYNTCIDIFRSSLKNDKRRNGWKEEWKSDSYIYKSHTSWIIYERVQ